jgi:hypothetical protein
MKWPRLVWIASAICLWGQGQLLQDASQIGPAAGAIAAEFSLLDQFGQRRTLESLMQPQGIVLIFFRSADW